MGHKTTMDVIGLLVDEAIRKLNLSSILENPFLKIVPSDVPFVVCSFVVVLLTDNANAPS